MKLSLLSTCSPLGPPGPCWPTLCLESENNSFPLFYATQFTKDVFTFSNSFHSQNDPTTLQGGQWPTLLCVGWVPGTGLRMSHTGGSATAPGSGTGQEPALGEQEKLVACLRAAQWQGQSLSAKTAPALPCHLLCSPSVILPQG